MTRILAVGALAALATTAALAAAGEAPAASRRVKFTYAFQPGPVPADAASAWAWIPIPAQHAFQDLVGYSVLGGVPAEVRADPEYGNHFLAFDLGALARAGKLPEWIQVEFRVARRAYRCFVTDPPKTDPFGLTPPAGALIAMKDSTPRDRYLAPDRLVPIKGQVLLEARLAAERGTTDLERGRLLYDHVVDTMRYDKTGVGWGRGDALRACSARAGNCTDFHSLFIGEARAVGLPARFLIGFPLPRGKREGEIPGYHCWAEFYVARAGWVPIDASEASKDRTRQEELFGGLDADRLEFTMGRDVAIPGARSGPVNYAIYPLVEIDGKARDGVTTRFTFRDLDAAEK